ncbi:transposase, IS4 family [Pseudomonas baetica]|uniref:Transposase, IS4 family n=3 Tax=Pseudomonas baetica TaxID=674054 RepID=A0ABX4Q0D6_9PSED|nr:IS4 family transposase [Pseudomonas baetica]PKA70214.1 transposase, IS4 family [Pseudomonas baetica]PKA71457.1 transposase, IS4 family [Pseudomonas baetica]PKA72100.1 transposase, IS4 family [Pseudomonas baetica]PTC19947.1 IS4 family transposase [Pseudomonas baetica]PTC21046.1 IS4 family transposase [Pseudomonas baetica]
MSVQQDLLDLGDLFNFCDLSTFTQNIPIEWVASALDLSSQATIRRRRLPADQVLWLVLGMALFRDEPVHEVARRLNICAQGLASDHLLARSGVTEARKRLGADPVEWLFRKTGTQWGAQRYPDDAWQDLQVFAVDGALLRTPDTPELRDHFGSGNTSTDRQTPFPMLRLVALMNVRSHLILDAQLSPYRRSEMRLADEFLQQIPDHSVTLFDKGFWSADLMLSLSGDGSHRHWLIPAKKGLVCEEVARYNEHDRLVRMKVSPQARKRNPTLPTHWEAREVSYEIQGKVKTVMTSLPAKIYSTKSVAKLYQERWEIELGFRDIKSSMQQNAMTLRSKKVDLIYQEVWGLLLAYNVIRREASQAAVAFGRAPSDIRFKPACQYIAVQLIVMAAANPVSATGRRLAELRKGVGGLFLDHRPRPSRPRTVKISKTRFPVDRKAAPLK